MLCNTVYSNDMDLLKPWVANRLKPWVANRLKPWVANRGLHDAEAYIPEPNTVIISITEPKNWRGYGVLASLQEGYVDVLRLQFEDFDSLKLHPKDAALFTVDQAKRVAEFVTQHRGKNILVHCSAGISRSGAVVDAILQAFPEYEDRGNPRHPNGHVRSLMKRALGLTPIGFIEEPLSSVTYKVIRVMQVLKPEPKGSIVQ
jgi:predicted protein tyrosine phosphatase